LKARVTHHRKTARRPHWHVDYLKPFTLLVLAWHTYDSICREHEWAAILSQDPRLSIPLTGFGASDCRCQSHLFFFQLPSVVQSLGAKLCPNSIEGCEVRSTNFIRPGLERENR
jgi:Uri superfamily endonuclease